VASQAVADRYDAQLGFYRIRANTSEGEAKVSNLGLVKMSYHLALTNGVTLRPGYSIYLLKGKKTDIGYGLDIGALWYPFSEQPSFWVENGPVKWHYNEIYRPYLCFSFHQRQYQSIQSSYAGVGLTIGTEFKPEGILPQSSYFTFEFNYLALDGPLESSLKEMQFIGGIGNQF